MKKGRSGGGLDNVVRKVGYSICLDPETKEKSPLRVGGVPRKLTGRKGGKAEISEKALDKRKNSISRNHGGKE